MELQYAEHHVSRLEYRLVWTPKYRHPVFKEPHRTILKQILTKAAYDYDMEIREIEIPPDHIHALIVLPPTISVSECMNILKSISAREFFAKFPKIKQKYFWGGKLWSPSYYAETVGKANELTIRKYILGQLKEETRHISKLKQLKLFT
jgi:putative transposase